jgi:hypothetical protein
MSDVIGSTPWGQLDAKGLRAPTVLHLRTHNGASRRGERREAQRHGFDIGNVISKLAN